MDNKNTRGYSEALGGFGVPQQVEATGGSNTASPKQRSSSGFKLGKTGAIIIIVAVVVVAALIFLFTNGFFGGDQYKNYIETIQISTQDSGGVASTNYLPKLTEGTDWATLNDNTRDGIAKYAVSAAISMAEQSNTEYYQVLGLSSTGTPVFMYAPDAKKIQIILGTEAPRTIDAD